MNRANVLSASLLCLLLGHAGTPLDAADPEPSGAYYQVYADQVQRWKIGPIADARALVNDVSQVPSQRMAAIEGILSRNDITPQDVIFFLRHKYELVAPMGTSAQYLVVIEYVKRSPSAWGITDVISFAHSNDWKVSEELIISAFRSAKKFSPGTAMEAKP